MSTGWERSQVQPVTFAGSQSGCLMQEKTGDQVEWIWFMQGNFACDCWFCCGGVHEKLMLTKICMSASELILIVDLWMYPFSVPWMYCLRKSIPSHTFLSRKYPQDTKALLHVPSQGTCWFGVWLLLLSWVFYVQVKAPAAWKQLLKSFTGNGRRGANKADKK